MVIILYESIRKRFVLATLYSNMKQHTSRYKCQLLSHVSGQGKKTSSARQVLSFKRIALNVMGSFRYKLFFFMLELINLCSFCLCIIIYESDTKFQQIEKILLRFSSRLVPMQDEIFKRTVRQQYCNKMLRFFHMIQMMKDLPTAVLLR